MFLSINHALLRREYISNELNTLPSGHVFDHQSKYKMLYISDYPGRQELKRKRISLSKREAAEILELIGRRAVLENELEEIDNYLKRPLGRCIPKNNPWLDREFFQLLEPYKDSNPVKKPKYAPHFNEIRFRSKSEMNIAQLLSSLGFNYIYEPKYAASEGLELYPDFVVDVPEIDRCFVLEHFGMMSESGYAESAEWKIAKYMQLGFLPGRDIIFTFESGNCPLDIDIVREQINALILANSVCLL